MTREGEDILRRQLSNIGKSLDRIAVALEALARKHGDLFPATEQPRKVGQTDDLIER